MQRPVTVYFATFALLLSSVGPLLLNAIRTFEATATAAKIGLTYGPRLPLEWLLAGIVTGALCAGALATFVSRRSVSRWLFGAAALLALGAAGSAARPNSMAHAVAGAALALFAAVAFLIGDRRSDGASHRSWLTERRSRIRGLFIGIGACALAIAVGLAEDERILPRSRLLAHGAVVCAVVAGLFALICIAAILVAWAARQESSGRRWLGRSAVAAFGIAVAFSAFATYSLGFHWKPTARLCSYGTPQGSLEERRRNTAEGARRAASVFSLLPELVGFRIRSACAEAQRELELIERGECPHHLIPGMSCRCGNERVPDDVRCQYAQCVRYDVPKLRCPDDRF